MATPYIDNYQMWLNRAVVKRAELAKEARLLRQSGEPAKTQQDNINWYAQLASGVADLSQTTELREQLLSLLVDNAKLFYIPDAPGIYGLTFNEAVTELASVYWQFIMGNPLSNTALASLLSGYLLNPMTTLGDTIYGGALGVPQRLGIGSSNAVLQTVAGVPAWSLGALSLASGKTLTASNTLTLSGTDGSSVAFGAGGTVAYVGSSNAWTAGIKQTFAPNGTNAGLNVGSFAGQPSVPVNGDIIYNSTAGAFQGVVGGVWTTFGTSGDGFVVGPASATDNAIARFDSTTGKLIQNSVVTISDGGNFLGMGTLNGHSILAVPPSTFALFSSKLSVFAATTSAELATVISDETGTGSLVFATSPTLVTPNIGVATGTSLATTGALTSGTSSSISGLLTLRNNSNNFTQTIRGTAPVANRIFDLPTGDPTIGQLLTASAPSGGVVTLSWSSALTNPMDNTGQLIYGGLAGAPTKLAANLVNAKRFLTSTASGGIGQAPAWSTVSGSDLASVVPLSLGGTAAALTDPNANRFYFWDDATGATVFAVLGGGLSYDVATKTVSVDASGIVNSVTGTANRITITGTANDPIVNIAATYVGQASITTVGTIGSGTWQGAIVDGEFGGTGFDVTSGAVGDSIRVNASQTAWEWYTPGGGGGGGTVTSVDASFMSGTGLVVTGGPITASGTLTFAWQGAPTDYIDGKGDFQDLAGAVNTIVGAAYVPYSGATGPIDLNAQNLVNVGDLTSGTLTYVPSNVLASFQTSVNSYNQLILQNSNAGSAASSDIIVNNDISTDTTTYGDFGINSSSFSGTGSLSAPNAVYLYANGGDLAIGTTSANYIRFVFNSAATDAFRIESSSRILIPSFGTAGVVLNDATGLLSSSPTLSPTRGGTGIANNAASTWTISGNFATTVTVSGATSVTFPTTGTLYGTASGSITSAQLATSLTDETGTGVVVFNNTPTLVTPVIGAATGTSLTASSFLHAGTASSATGQLRLAHASTANLTTITAGNAANALTFVWPVVDPTSGQVLSASAPSGGVVTLSWTTGGGGGSSALSAITAATGTNSINNATFAQTWGWDTLSTQTGFALTANAITTGTLLALSSTSTAGNAGTLLTIARTGANANATRTNNGASISVTTTGTTSTNTALTLTASGATTNYALLVTAGLAGFGTSTPSGLVSINGATAAIPHLTLTPATVALTGTTDGMLSYQNVSGTRNLVLYKNAALDYILTQNTNSQMVNANGSRAMDADSSGNVLANRYLIPYGKFNQYSTVTVNSTSETSVLTGTTNGTLVFNASTNATNPELYAGAGWLIKGYGTFVTGAVITGTLRFRWKLTGSTVYADTGAVTIATRLAISTTYVVDIELSQDVRTDGASGTIFMCGSVKLIDNATGLLAAEYPFGTGTSTALDTTANRTLDMTIEMATTAQTFNLQAFKIFPTI